MADEEREQERQAAPVRNNGWVISPGFAAQAPSEQASSFYALYDGADFAGPEATANGRGLAAVIAQSHPDAGQPGTAARDAAQLAVHSFAEGYFGARRTLSARRAAAVSLTSLNRWLAAQMYGDVTRHPTPVSLSALLLQHRRVAIVQIGTCQILRLRGGVLTPLIRPHLRLGEGGRPSRALGLEDDLALAFQEDEAEPGDIFLLLAGAGLPELVYAALSPLAALPFAGVDVLAARTLAMLPGPGKSVMALRVESLPDADEADASAHLADLPLRSPPREGDVWDDYAIGKTLFRGRYTILKAAIDTRTGHEVALKIPLKSMLQDEVFTAGFMREAWIGTTVRSACVVHYIDVPRTRRTSLYLVMPLYYGETLEARLNRLPFVNLPEGIGIALKLCEAIQDLGAIQVIHRDIKPDNVMLPRERGEVKLLDLGLAYLPGIDAADATKPGGTIRYMAPELLRGSPASPRTEVYALGVTLYRMFSGGPFPFGQHEKLPLAKMRPDLPHWLGEALARALAVKPEERFADTGEFASALQAGLAEGQERPLPARRALLPPLRLWQAAAVIFALATAVLASKLLK
jgi:Protein kinase domain